MGKVEEVQLEICPALLSFSGLTSLYSLQLLLWFNLVYLLSVQIFSLLLHTTWVLVHLFNLSFSSANSIKKKRPASGLLAYSTSSCFSYNKQNECRRIIHFRSSKNFLLISTHKIPVKTKFWLIQRKKFAF